MTKRVFSLFSILLFILSVHIAEAQPPPPPPDPGLGGSHGWVGKSTMGDGYGILLSMGLAYAGWHLYRIRKKKIEKCNN